MVRMVKRKVRADRKRIFRYLLRFFFFFHQIMFHFKLATFCRFSFEKNLVCFHFSHHLYFHSELIWFYSQISFFSSKNTFWIQVNKINQIMQINLQHWRLKVKCCGWPKSQDPRWVFICVSVCIAACMCSNGIARAEDFWYWHFGLATPLKKCFFFFIRSSVFTFCAFFTFSAVFTIFVGCRRKQLKNVFYRNFLQKIQFHN